MTLAGSVNGWSNPSALYETSWWQKCRAEEIPHLMTTRDRGKEEKMEEGREEKRKEQREGRRERERRRRWAGGKRHGWREVEEGNKNAEDSASVVYFLYLVFQSFHSLPNWYHHLRAKLSTHEPIKDTSYLNVTVTNRKKKSLHCPLECAIEFSHLFSELK